MKILVIVALLAINLVSCERIGAINVSGPDEEVVLVKAGSGLPTNEYHQSDLEYYEEEGVAYRVVADLWAYAAVTSFVWLCYIFPPYRWLLYGMILFIAWATIDQD